MWGQLNSIIRSNLVLKPFITLITFSLWHSTTVLCSVRRKNQTVFSSESVSQSRKIEGDTYSSENLVGGGRKG
jgi:hypothetical protein